MRIPYNTSFRKMKYHLIIEGESTSDVDISSRVLGESSFDSFYPDAAFVILAQLLEENPEYLDLIEIRDSRGKSYTVSEFLSEISHLRVIRH